MSQEIDNPHDKLIKQVLGEPENAASFLAANLPAVKVLPPPKLSFFFTGEDLTSRHR